MCLLVCLLGLAQRHGVARTSRQGLAKLCQHDPEANAYSCQCLHARAVHMSSIGQFAVGVSHSNRQPYTVQAYDLLAQAHAISFSQAWSVTVGFEMACQLAVSASVLYVAGCCSQQHTASHRRSWWQLCGPAGKKGHSCFEAYVSHSHANTTVILGSLEAIGQHCFAAECLPCTGQPCRDVTHIHAYNSQEMLCKR
jgi:hypothetical protein